MVVVDETVFHQTNNREVELMNEATRLERICVCEREKKRKRVVGVTVMCCVKQSWFGYVLFMSTAITG